MDELLNDKRFAYVARDPKFKKIPKAERKVKIDKRFQSMFKDKKFTVQYTIDKRGRPVNQTSSENLKKYYDLSSSEQENDEEEQEKPSQREKKFRKHKKKGSTKNKTLRLKENLKESKRQLNITSKHESKKLTDDIKAKLRNLSVNYARGEGLLMTDSSSDEASSENSVTMCIYHLDEDIEHNWGELDKETETTEEITHRLAVCNMDWDRIRAVDLMVLFNSFLPTGGFIRSVTIYPSEFGLQRMKEEEIKGPKELTDINKEIENENDVTVHFFIFLRNLNATLYKLKMYVIFQNEEGSTYHMEKLRQYQLNRLKYYYAVADFDSFETANKIYSDCDGTEYESTATKLDLRFIPDDMEFHQLGYSFFKTPKEVCSKLPDPTKYQPRQFTTTALQQVKVQLTWDETNPERMEIAQKLNSGKLNEITDNDLQAYLATESSDNESGKEEGKKSQNESDSEAEENVEPIEKYKALLKEIEEKEESKQKKDVELEFTWGLGTKEKAEKLVQERLKKDQKLTPFEQYLEKRKEKKKAKREERKKRKDGDRDVLDSEDSEMLSSDNEIENNKLSFRGGNTIGNDSFTSSDSEGEEKRKAELELLLMDENDDGKQHFNMKKIEENATMTKSKQKRLSKKKNGQNQIIKDGFEVNVRDSRFNALYTSHHFNIDPADPHYRKTKGSEALIKEKLKRRIDSDHNEVSKTCSYFCIYPLYIYQIPTKEKKMNSNITVELQSLIKSVKKNAKNISRPIK
ncbi:ESF1 like protein [Melipona quadrifasciata]|uniref:ESF1 like protein n=1 Tax=Melipona quadrifasciata TaxID=166423 RepID=A0A0M9A760_9HYME|nr:ESF1 like protein [Melipona quadrifasciata]